MDQFVSLEAKRRARDMVSSAIRAGRLVRPARCSRCPSPDPQAHHEDYGRPLDVTWLCRDCHETRARSLRLAGLAPPRGWRPRSNVDPRALGALREDTSGWRAAKAAEVDGRPARDAAIRRALAAGLPVSVIAETAGVTRGVVGSLARRRQRTAT